MIKEFEPAFQKQKKNINTNTKLTNYNARDKSKIRRC